MRFRGEIKPLVVILGPTAVGKTATAISLAQHFDGEIISADSRQIYLGMDIGTAKPNVDEQAAIPHHLINITPPDVPVNVTQFQQMAYGVVDELLKRDKLPLLVGGTGQYISAILEGWQIPEILPHHELRTELEQFATEHGWEELLERLRQLDPVTAATIDGKNLRRVIRALEVCIVSGRPFSELRQKNPPPYRVLEIGLTLDRQMLYDRADQRIDKMIEHGLLDEIRTLIKAGYTWNLPAMTSLGYLEMGNYLQGLLNFDEAVKQFKHATHHFIRRQYTWFRKYNPKSHWFESLSSTLPSLQHLIENWLREYHV